MAATAEWTDGQRDTRACCGNRQLRETGGKELSENGRAWWGVFGWRWADMRAGGHVDRKILTTGGVAAAVSQSPHHYRISPANITPGAPV